MSKISRNDLCPCGSGKKYKKCCLKYESNPIILWEKNFDEISHEIQQCQNIKTIFFSILKIMHKEKWEGACHATSSIMYVLLKELEMHPDLYIGEVKKGNIIFDHSWIQIDDKVYDAAISMGLEGRIISNPIIADYNIDTLKKVDVEYGVKTAEGLGYPANVIQNISIVDYMDKFPCYEDGLWKIVCDIGSELGINFDIAILRNKYSSVKWKSK